MPWSTAATGPAEPVLGDPASLAALGSALQRTAADLDILLGAVEEVSRAHTPTAPDSVSGAARDTATRLHGVRLRELSTRGTAVTRAMERAGRRVTDHASELADALALARRIGERARSSGLQLDGGTVTRPTGVHGVADVEAERGRAEAAARLQRVLDTVLVDLDSARRAVRDDLGALRRDLEATQSRYDGLA